MRGPMIGWEPSRGRGRLGAGMEMVQGSDKELDCYS
jgi:hypothetical protein